MSYNIFGTYLSSNKPEGFEASSVADVSIGKRPTPTKILNPAKEYKTKPSKNFFSVFGDYVSSKINVTEKLTNTDPTSLEKKADTVLTQVAQNNIPQTTNQPIASTIERKPITLVNATYYNEETKAYLDVTDKMKKYTSVDSIMFNGSYNAEFSDIASGKVKKLDISYRCGNELANITTLNENDNISIICPSITEKSPYQIDSKLNITNVYSECPNMPIVDITNKVSQLSNGKSVSFSKNQFIGLLPKSYQSCNPKLNIFVSCDDKPNNLKNADINGKFTIDCSQISPLDTIEFTKQTVGSLPIDKLKYLTPTMIINAKLDNGDFNQKQLNNLNADQLNAITKLNFPKPPDSCNGNPFTMCINNNSLDWCYNNCIDQKSGESVTTPPLNETNKDASNYIMIVNYKNNEGTMDKRNILVENIVKLNNGHQVYLAYDVDGNTRMISTNGIAKYYFGPTSNFKPENWKFYNIAPVNSYIVIPKKSTDNTNPTNPTNPTIADPIKPVIVTPQEPEKINEQKQDKTGLDNLLNTLPKNTLLSQLIGLLAKTPAIANDKLPILANNREELSDVNKKPSLIDNEISEARKNPPDMSKIMFPENFSSKDIENQNILIRKEFNNIVRPDQLKQLQTIYIDSIENISKLGAAEASKIYMNNFNKILSFEQINKLNQLGDRYKQINTPSSQPLTTPSSQPLNIPSIQSFQTPSGDYLTTQTFNKPQSDIKGQTCSCTYKY